MEANSECRPSLPEFKPHPHHLAAGGPLLWSAFPYLNRRRGGGARCRIVGHKEGLAPFLGVVDTLAAKVQEKIVYLNPKSPFIGDQ